MALTPFDVTNLNQSIQNLGNVAFRKQAQEEQRQRDISAELMRKAMLANEQRRLDIEQNRENLLQEGHVDAWLQGPEGGAMRYTGTQTGYQNLLKQAEGIGKPLKVMDAPPTNKPQYGAYTYQTDNGDVTVHLNSEGDLQKAVETAKALGGKARQARGFETRESYNAKQWQAYQDQADQLEDQARSESDATQADRQAMLEHARRMRSFADQFFKPSAAGDSVTETVTERPDPNNPGKTLTERSTSRRVRADGGRAGGGGIRFVRDRNGRLVLGQ